MLVSVIPALQRGQQFTSPQRRSAETSVQGKVAGTMREVTRGAKSLDWCSSLNLVAFERVTGESYFQVAVMNPDGSGERCVTCGSRQVPKRNGNPAWHPSGRYLVFTAEKPDNPAKSDQVAVPGRGLNCDLWLVTPDGRQFYRA
jgi:hypothetical protein